MRKILFPAVAAALLATSFGAYAADATATGTIKSIDDKAMTVTLDGGVVYKLPAGFKAADLKVGEKITVTWVMKGTEHDATAIVVAK
jgi:Cu/Ag efflux protein CusF